MSETSYEKFQELAAFRIPSFDVKAARKNSASVDPLPRGAKSLQETIKTQKPKLREVLENFLEISQFFRKSGQEKDVRNFIAKLADKKHLHYEADNAGNLLVRVPGAGRAAYEPPLALQGHMDMVVDVDPKVLQPEQSPDAFLKNGVRLVAESGWVHSLNFQSSIGADDGLGVSIMMRYMEDRRIQHPPLELIFTTNEETGLGGANDLNLGITANRMINLDADDDIHKVTMGCLGGATVGVELSAVQAAAVPPDSRRIDISVSGLRGGHSGINIHLHRANAVKLLAAFLGELRRSIPEAQIASADAGDLNVFNKIPSSFHISLAVPVDKLQLVKSQASAYWEKTKAALVGEDQAASLDIQEKDGTAAQGLAAQDADKIIALVDQIPNAVLEEAQPGEDVAYRTSSNIGFMSIKSENGAFAVRYGVMPRSFYGDAVQKAIDKVLRIADSSGFNKNVKTKKFPAWAPNSDSALLKDFIRAARRNMPDLDLHAEPAMGGLETAVFTSKFPDMDIIAIGAPVKEEHSRNERFDIESLGKEIALLDGFLASY